MADTIAIWILSAASVIQAWHISSVYREQLKLRERVHQLEVDQIMRTDWGDKWMDLPEVDDG